MYSLLFRPNQELLNCGIDKKNGAILHNMKYLWTFRTLMCCFFLIICVNIFFLPLIQCVYFVNNYYKHWKKHNTAHLRIIKLNIFLWAEFRLLVVHWLQLLLNIYAVLYMLQSPYPGWLGILMHIFQGDVGLPNYSYI